MFAKPQKEHEWLQRLIGRWSVSHEVAEGCGQDGGPPPAWTETVRSLHGMWVVCEGQGEIPAVGPATSVMTLGYDPRRNRYVGNWVGSMMTHMWVYEGRLDETGTVLTLDCEGPDFEGGQDRLLRYQDVIALLSDDHRTLTARVQQDDGTWKELMTAHYRRLA